MNTSMKKLVTAGTLGMAGLVAGGLVAFQTPGAVASDDVYKRNDDAPDVVKTIDDDDDDDTFGRGDTNTNTRTGAGSRDSRDGTNSRHTGVSRDRDRSRGDLTRDKTYDGAGGKKRDWSKNHTNDRSRNDSRR